MFSWYEKHDLGIVYGLLLFMTTRRGDRRKEKKNHFFHIFQKQENAFFFFLCSSTCLMDLCCRILLLMGVCPFWPSTSAYYFASNFINMSNAIHSIVIMCFNLVLPFIDIYPFDRDFAHKSF